MGFLAAIKLRRNAWQPLLTLSRIEHGLLLPILLHCTDKKHGRPMLGPTRPGKKARSSSEPPITTSQWWYRPSVNFGCRSAPAADHAEPVNRRGVVCSQRIRFMGQVVRRRSLSGCRE